jgi:hypothetical protein
MGRRLDYEVEDDFPDHETCCVCLEELPKTKLKLKSGETVVVLSPDQVTRVCSLLNRHNDDCAPGGYLYKRHFSRFKTFVQIAQARINGKGE